MNPQAFAQQKIPPQRIKPDLRMANTQGTDIYLLRVRPEKLFNWQGQPVNGVVEVLNNTDAPKAFIVRAWITNGLDTIAGKQEKTVNVPAFTQQKVDFTWDAAMIAPYGHALCVEVVQDGKVIARGEDYFSSADNVWAVGIAGGHPVAFTADHVRDMAGIEAAVERFRAKYINTLEKFFWAPDDFANMMPTTEKWYSGQVRYHEQMDRFKHLMDYGNQIGVLPTTYGKSLGSGSGARDVIRKHPELVNGYGGVMRFSPDTEELAKWDKEDSTWQSLGWAFYNMNDPAVVQWGIDQIIGSTTMFGWAGVRFDGHFRAQTGKARVGDNIVDFTPDMADAQTAANQKALKDQMRKVNPRFVYGYNYAECAFNDHLAENPRETIELCADGGHIMDEYAKHNTSAAHPFRRWADYAHMLAQSTDQARRLDGNYFPMVQPNGPVGRYQSIFTFAAGGHPNGSGFYNDFATRYAGVLWDKGIKNVWNPSGLVIIKHGVLWEDYVRQQQLDTTHMRLIIHLINPPVQETAPESKEALDELNRREKRRSEIKIAADKAKIAPDYSELDKLPPVQLYPDPLKDVAVKFVPRALEGGPWTLQRALVLDPETVTEVSLPIDQSDPYFWQMRVPEVKFWAVVVLDLVRKEN
ncbi:MAG: hypothetical protein ACYDBB_08910 [Armatimonadota bacterium]